MKTDEFTIIEIFTNYISQSQSFSPSLTFSTRQSEIPEATIDFSIITYSMSLSITYVNRKSVTFSALLMDSNVYSYSYIKVKDSYTMVLSKVYSYQYYPYIIYYLSPTYIHLYLSLERDLRKPKITGEQLIGICCGSASVFFLILGIIIIAIKKKKRLLDDESEINYFSDSDSEENVKITRIVTYNQNDINKVTNKSNKNQDSDSFEFSGLWF